MMLAINFRMDEEQCQDLFEFLDVDHDNRITRAEFTQIVVDKNMDLSKLFKKIRRLCLKHNFDLEMQLRQKDERQSG
jgi:Ca2+-binding EF-hand superfamily protein